MIILLTNVRDQVIVWGSMDGNEVMDGWMGYGLWVIFYNVSKKCIIVRVAEGNLSTHLKQHNLHVSLKNATIAALTCCCWNEQICA